MTAEATAADVVVKRRATPAERRATAVGIVLVMLGVFVFWVFGLGTESGSTSTFNLSLPGERFEGLTWAVNSRWLAFIETFTLWQVSLANRKDLDRGRPCQAPGRLQMRQRLSPKELS